MNDLEAAQAVRDGLLPSPSKFGNGWLFALRISGTGMADRPAVGETTYRPPEVWASPEMQARANGLPVILGHPQGKILNSDEYAGRSIGAIVLPYVRASELWGVARILDADAAKLMATGDFSTSPGVGFAKDDATLIEGAEGALLIEGDPTLLDHLAVIPNGEAKDGTAIDGGVWGKGGAPSGIRNDQLEITTMDNEKIEDAKADSSKEGATLDKLLTAVDALTTMCGSLGTRMDALEKQKPEELKNPNGDPDGTPKQVAADERNSRADDAMMAEDQARCDQIASAFGMRAPAAMLGEARLAYRKRMARAFQKHSPSFKDADLSAIADEKTFSGVEATIYADALQAARNPENFASDELIPIRRTDPDTGHRITEFRGSRTFITAMKRQPMAVTAFLLPNRAA
jgi:hypothetical protein